MKTSIVSICTITTLTFILVVIIACNKPVDIRNDYLKKGISFDDKKKGQEFLQLMEKAYGGRETWELYKYATFTQEADWYGRKYFSNWDTLPQLYKMHCQLGSENAELTILNGPLRGDIYSIDNSRFLIHKLGHENIEKSITKYYDKILYKNYWFQFPFRIKEAQVISFGGEEIIHGKNYIILYATWRSENANKEYDQFLLYLNSTNYRIEYLHFTLRDKISRAHFTARFDNFKEINELTLPYSQYVRYGKPSGKGIKLHENHYTKIEFQEY